MQAIVPPFIDKVNVYTAAAVCFCNTVCIAGLTAAFFMAWYRNTHE